MVLFTVEVNPALLTKEYVHGSIPGVGTMKRATPSVTVCVAPGPIEVSDQLEKLPPEKLSEKTVTAPANPCEKIQKNVAIKTAITAFRFIMPPKEKLASLYVNGAENLKKMSC